MEGAQGGDAPPAVRTSYGVPGWHSASAAPFLTEGPEGPLKGGDPGVSVLAGFTAPEPWIEDAPRGAGLIPLPLHEPFAGDDLGRRAARLAARCPAPVAALHPDDASELGLDEGAPVTVGGAGPVPLTLDESIPRGHVGASAGRLLPRGMAHRVIVEAAG
jgi:NADH-quinone oxidoreductase subunit G